LGAPLANGTPSLMHAHAYIMELAIAGSFSSRPFSNASMEAWTGPGSM